MGVPLFGIGDSTLSFGSFGASTITGVSGAVGDLFAADADKAKAQGDLLEKQNYLLASDLATQNAEFTAQSTAIKTAQIDRETFKAIGGEQADIAGAGLQQSGSAIDLLRESASEGALTKAVASQQGLITEAGFTEQAQADQTQAQAAQVAADAANEAAKGAGITGAIKGVAALASLFTLGTAAPGAALGAAATSAMGDPTGPGGLY
jgi:hypothetical protein